MNIVQEFDEARSAHSESADLPKLAELYRHEMQDCLHPMSAYPREAAAKIPHMKADIDRLFTEQAKALKSATYLGMTPEEAKQCDERRKKITHLMKKLFHLQGESR